MLSVNFWIRLKRGSTIDITIKTLATTTATNAPVNAVSCQFLPAILQIAQMAVIGAFTAICIPIEINV